MRKDNARGKKGTLVQCSKCGYKWKVKNPNKPFICCSNCKRYFKPIEGIKKARKK
jgi:hypothetical protein